MLKEIWMEMRKQPQKLLMLILLVAVAVTQLLLLGLVVVHGNSATASKLATARNIKIQGAVSGNANFDGSANVIINTTQANIAILTGNITLTKGSGSANVNYPAGYTQSNCIPIAGGCKYSGVDRYAFGAFQSLGSTGVYLNASNIGFSVSAFQDEIGPSGTYPFKIVLMKIA